MLIIYKGIFLKLWSKVLHIFLLFSLYFSSLNLKYLKLTKMDITRFAMNLFIYIPGVYFETLNIWLEIRSVGSIKSMGRIVISPWTKICTKWAYVAPARVHYWTFVCVRNINYAHGENHVWAVNTPISKEWFLPLTCQSVACGLGERPINPQTDTPVVCGPRLTGQDH